MKCHICGHHCLIPEGGVGRCRMQTCSEGAVTERYPDRYLAIWPGAIETVPFLHVTPGARYLLLSTLGCNLSCPGCVSHILIEHQDALSEAMTPVSPEMVISKVRDHSCEGVIFCLNEPSVSPQTVLRTADHIRKAGLKVGCATNGCMSLEVLSQFLECMDFVNIGLKGYSDQAYLACQAPCGTSDVYRTIRKVHEQNVHLEASVVYHHGADDDVIRLAEALSRVSPSIPLHIMRFIPFAGADATLEPSPDEAEFLVHRCREYLPWVYLFNTPATDHLITICPDCKKVLIERSFYGPMGARLSGKTPSATCDCGCSVPVVGSFHGWQGCEPRFRGGYRTSVALDSVTGTLQSLGITNEKVTGRVLVQVLSGNLLEDLQVYYSTPEGYIEYIRMLSSLAGIDDLVSPLIRFYEDRLENIRKCVAGLFRPRVFCALSHPLLPSYPDKMEVALADRAGGDVLNRKISHTEDQSSSFSREEFISISPEVIICTGMGKFRLEDFVQICQDLDITAPALENGRVYGFLPGHSLTGLQWIISLEYLAEILHPEVITIDWRRDAAILEDIISQLHREVSARRSVKGSEEN